MARHEQFSMQELTMQAVDSANKGSLVALSLTPASVAAATVASQNLTVPGVKVGDRVFCVGTPITNATAVADVSVGSADTLAVRFINPTAGPLTPTSGTYVFFVIRKG